MKIEMRYIVGLLVLAIVILGCKKEAGEGGTASITGKVEVYYRTILSNPASQSPTSFPAFDTEVYINYGDEIGPNDRIRTNYKGEYEFPNLRPGDYTIYVYSRDTINGDNPPHAPENMVVKQEVTISKRKDKVESTIMYIYDRN